MTKNKKNAAQFKLQREARLMASLLDIKYTQAREFLKKAADAEMFKKERRLEEGRRMAHEAGLTPSQIAWVENNKHQIHRIVGSTPSPKTDIWPVDTPEFGWVDEHMNLTHIGEAEEDGYQITNISPEHIERVIEVVQDADIQP